MRPIKTIRDNRFTYLDNLGDIYKNMGYSVKLSSRDNLLEIFEKGTEIPKTAEEVVIDKWIHQGAL